MRLYVEELKATTLVQVFTRETDALVDRVRLHLCKYLSPAGTFTVSLTDESNNVIGTSSQTLAAMQAAGDTALSANYYHGQVTFQFSRAYTLRKNQVYKLKLSSSGYTYSDTDFIGWVKADTDRAIELTDDSTPLLVDSPYDFEIYALQRVR